MTHMQRALDLALKALGNTSPNPPVGAVVVKNGVIVGEGWTQPPGGPHAEINALEQAGALSYGSTLFTTLEPCCYQSRTPPCTSAIVEAGVTDVRIATLDPNVKVNGRGKSALEEAGLRVSVGECENCARELMESYLHWATTGRPMVIAKYAMSLDGKTATVGGESRWITDEDSRLWVHYLRRNCDAVGAGIGTILQDNPKLTARDINGKPLDSQPLRVIIDSSGRIPSNAQLLGEPGTTLIAVAKIAPKREFELRELGADILSVPGPDNRVDLRELIRILGTREVTSILIEGGGTLLASLLEAGLVDKVIAFLAPILIGGKSAPTPVSGNGIAHLTDALNLNSLKVQQLGRDLVIMGYLQHRS